MNYAESLIGILERELALYTELLSVVRAQRPSITSGNVVQLSELVSQSEGIIHKVREVELSLMELAREYAADSNLPPGDTETAILAMVSHVKEEESDRVVLIRDGIEDTLRSIAEANAANAELLQDALHYVDNTMKLIAQADGSNSIYSRLGILNKEAARVAIDDRA